MSLVLTIIYWIMQVYGTFISLNILISWVPKLAEYKFFRTCLKISDWYLGPFHGSIVLGSLDFTPMIGIVLYEMVISCLFFLMSAYVK